MDQDSSSGTLDPQNKIQSDDVESGGIRLPSRFRPISAVLPPKRAGSNQMARFVTYQLIREKVMTWKGQRIHYQFNFLDNPLYHTKSMTSKPTDPVPLGNGQEIHFSQSAFAGFLLIGNSNSSFSVRKESHYGPEMLSLEILSNRNGNPRIISASLFNQDSFLPSKLVSLDPIKGPNGHWQLCFFGKPAVPSIKNCVLIGKDDKIPYVIFRRVSETTFEIDAPEVFPSLSLFGLGLSLLFV